MTRSSECQPSWTMVSKNHLAYNPRLARTITVQVAGTRPRKAFNSTSHSGFQGCFTPALRIFHRIGTAHPRFVIGHDRLIVTFPFGQSQGWHSAIRKVVIRVEARPSRLRASAAPDRPTIKGEVHPAQRADGRGAGHQWLHRLQRPGCDPLDRSPAGARRGAGVSGSAGRYLPGVRVGSGPWFHTSRPLRRNRRRTLQ